MKHLKRLAVAAGTVMTVLVMATPASAAPAPGYEEFADCPDRSVNPLILQCITTTSNGGHLQLGDLHIPITDAIELDGARTVSGQFIVGAFHAGSQEVEGGLVGATGQQWLQYLFPPEYLELHADIELAGAPTNPTNPTRSLPIKVKLENPLLSDTCYIGSDTTPIQLILTVGTTAPPPPNMPISGSFGTVTSDPSILGTRINGRVYVDNSFAVPAASGCDMFGLPAGFVDALINARAELPSAAGNNEAVLPTTGAIASVQNVYPPFGTE